MRRRAPYVDRVRTTILRFGRSAAGGVAVEYGILIAMVALIAVGVALYAAAVGTELFNPLAKKF